MAMGDQRNIFGFGFNERRPDMKHTRGPWHWHNEKTYNLAGKGSYQEGDILHCKGKPSNGDADLISLAPTAPHDCDDPNCPGAVNKKRLEMFEEMAEVVKRFVDYYAGSKKSHLGNGQAYKSHGEMEILLAKIKED